MPGTKATFNVISQLVNEKIYTFVPMLIKLLHSVSINKLSRIKVLAVSSGVMGGNKPLLTWQNGTVVSSILFWYFNGIMFEKKKTAPNDFINKYNNTAIQGTNETAPDS